MLILAFDAIKNSGIHSFELHFFRIFALVRSKGVCSRKVKIPAFYE